MISNYIKTALRNFYRNKSITFIKILGLALGLAVTFFILIYVSTETSYNDYNQKKERIFRVNQVNNIHGWKSTNTPFPMRDALLAEFPIIKEATRAVTVSNIKVIMNDNSFENNQILCVDQSFFKMFTLDKIAGDFSTFDYDISNVVLTESSAIKFFGTSNVVNESLKIYSGKDEFNLNIVAVIKDIPRTSTIKADFISTIELGLNQANKRMFWSDGKERDPDMYRTDWSINFVETYLLLDNTKSSIGFDKKLEQLETNHLNDISERDYYLQNLEDIYLYSGDFFGNELLGDLNSIYIFSAIAFLVLLIACINYIILSISQILTRTKEIGIRKIAGAMRSDLLRQIAIESLMLICITLPLAFILIEQFRPALEQIISKQIVMIYNWKFIVGFFSIIGFVVFIPGLNIVYFLNKISPVSILKKEGTKSVQGFSLRKALITLQFIIFIVLVVFAIGIKRQINYSSKNNLGFNPENKLVIPVENLVKNGDFLTLKTELLKNPEIKNISGAMWLPPSNSRMSFSVNDTSYGNEPIKLEALFVDKDFIENFEIQILEGRSLNEFENKDRMVVVNESAADMLGRESIIGKNLWDGKVIGIVNDFRFHSVHEENQPMMLIIGEYMIREMVINYNASINQETISKLKLRINELYPEIVIEPEFLKDRFIKLYEREVRLGILISIFSFLAIFIASIGLLGITIFNTKKQTKSIAIRKVHGASSIIIWKLLISNYVKLIVIALVIAVPISYVILNVWLQSFAYRTSIAWWFFSIAGVLALSISLATISWYSIKAARQNPVESLRYE